LRLRQSQIESDLNKLKTSFLDSVLSQDKLSKSKDYMKRKELVEARLKVQNYSKYIKEMHPPQVKSISVVKYGSKEGGSSKGAATLNNDYYSVDARSRQKYMMEHVLPTRESNNSAVQSPNVGGDFFNGTALSQVQSPADRKALVWLTEKKKKLQEKNGQKEPEAVAYTDYLKERRLMKEEGSPKDLSRDGVEAIGKDTIQTLQKKNMNMLEKGDFVKQQLLKIDDKQKRRELEMKYKVRS